MATAYSYSRYSTPEQSKGDSIRRQTSLLEGWLKRHPEHTIDDTLRMDKGKSGWRGANLQGALGEFLKDIEHDKIREGSILVVESLDRLSRQQVDPAYQLVRSILLAGVSVQTLSPESFFAPADVNNPMKVMEVLFIASRANEESEIKSSRLIAAWEKRRQEAIKSNKPMTSICPSWLELHDGKFIPIPEKVNIVRRLFKMASDGFGMAIRRYAPTAGPSACRAAHPPES